MTAFPLYIFSVFEGLPIPYPKREFISGDDNDDKADTGASKVGAHKVRHALSTS